MAWVQDVNSRKKCACRKCYNERSTFSNNCTPNPQLIVSTKQQGGLSSKCYVGVGVTLMLKLEFILIKVKKAQRK